MGECPLCDRETTGQKFMENGQWTLGALDVGSPDYVCAEWGSENLKLYFHSDAEVDESAEDKEEMDTPDDWEEEGWEEAVEEAAARAEISLSRGTLTTKTIDEREYYYLQWREGETVRSQYVAPVSPS